MPAPRDWPTKAENARTEAIELAQEIQQLVKETSAAIGRNPHLAAAKLSQIEAEALRIELVLVKAKQAP